MIPPLTLARRSLLAALPLALSFAAAYWFVAAALLKQWADDPSYAHGFFVIPMAAVLAWRRRVAYAGAPRRSDSLGLVAVAAAGVLYLGGLLAAELFTVRVSLIVALAGALLALEGRERFRTLRFPLLFLLAMVPVPYVFYYRLTFPLQLESSRLAAGLLSAAGLPLFREGNVIHLVDYSLEVVAACSGLRSVMTLGTMALFLCDFLKVPGILKVAFAVLSIPVALGANVVRLCVTAAVAAVGGPEAADSFLHELSGLVVFVTGVLAMVVCGRALEWIARART